MKLSILLPTYNCEKTIKECLDSIFSQDFPKKDFEVLFIDGGSTDRTLEIAKKYDVKIIDNPKKITGAAILKGVKMSKGKILASIDADNILVGKDWMEKMLKPFEDKEIAFSEVLSYGYRKKDKWGVKYQALIGGDDPLAIYLGFYSRWNYFMGNWTGCPYFCEDKGEYLKIKLKNIKKIPAMGSNGFLVRKELAKKFIKKDYIDTDFIYDIIVSGNNCFAKVKVKLIHNQEVFFSKKIYRIKRRYSGEIKTKYNFNLNKKKVFLTAAYILCILPVLWDTIKGYSKKPDLAWLFHPIASIGMVFIYFFYGEIYLQLIKKGKNNYYGD
jgi:glycosyltransferase involved in cell wall biosynthesis